LNINSNIDKICELLNHLDELQNVNPNLNKRESEEFENIVYRIQNSSTIEYKSCLNALNEVFLK
jgi:hypothetical protein